MEILTNIAHLLRQFFVETVVYVRKHSQDVPKRETQKWHVERENRRRVLNRRRTAFPDYSLFLGNRSKDIEALSPFPQLRQAIEPDARISHAFLQTASGDLGWFLLFSYLIPIVSTLLQAVDEGKELEAEISMRINLLDDFLKKDTFTEHLYAPLLNFKSDSEKVDLADGVVLSAVPDRQLEKYVNTISLFKGDPDLHQFLGLEFQLEATAEIPRVNPYLPSSETDFPAKCQSLLRAFRLHRAGAIGLALVGGESDHQLGLGKSWAAFARYERFFGNTYQFSAADAPGIADLHSRLTQINEDRRFELAMSRFIASYEKPLDGDRLIDYWIALEALLMPESDTAELSYRVSLRAAAFIGAPRERKQLFNTIRDSYKARSKFVHGAVARVESAIVLTTEECLRKALLRCLHLGGAPTRAMLDSLILEP
jgi:hypothetical protein